MFYCKGLGKFDLCLQQANIISQCFQLEEQVI